MNDKRRKKIYEAASLLDAVFNMIDSIRDEESDCLYNMPENLEGSDQYERMETAVENLENALESIEDAKNSLDDASV